MATREAVLNAPRHRTKLSRGLIRNEWFELSFLPAFGCHWTRLRLSVKGERVDLLKPVPDGDALLDRPLAHGSYILAPWAGPLDGRLAPHGRAAARAGPVVHGDVRTRPWKIMQSGESFFESVLDTAELADFNYPYGLRFHHTVRLHEDRLTVGMEVENTDSVPVPAGLGFHPIVLRRLSWRDDDLILLVPARKVCSVKSGVASDPMAPIEKGGALDLRRLRLLGGARIDHCFTDLEERHVRLIYAGSGVEVRLELDESFTYVVVQTPSQNANRATGPAESAPGPFIALTLATHPPGVLASEPTARDRAPGLRVLDPGERWRTRWSLSAGDL